MTAWLVIAALLGSIAAGLGGYFHGRDVEQGIAAQQQLADERLAAAMAMAKQRRIDRLAADLERARGRQIVQDREIIKEVVRYETIIPAASRCELPGAWRLLHDAAATGEPANTAGLVAGAGDTVADAAAIETVADNYADCRDWRSRLDGWQRWWAASMNTGLQAGDTRPAGPGAP